MSARVNGATWRQFLGTQREKFPQPGNATVNTRRGDRPEISLRLPPAADAVREKVQCAWFEVLREFGDVEPNIRIRDGRLYVEVAGRDGTVAYAAASPVLEFTTREEWERSFERIQGDTS